jgi:hypothetical protein
MEIWDQPVEIRIAIAQARLLDELHKIRSAQVSRQPT